MNGLPAFTSAASSPQGLPTGTITFLFTDIEGSTRLWEKHSRFMQTALARHDAVLHEAIRSAGGVVFKTVGDAFCAAFPDAFDALAAAARAQNALYHEPWPAGEPALRVRMALHTGTAEARDRDYFGPVLNRIARLLSTGRGGQIVLSGATYELLRDKLPLDGVTLQDLGQHRLKDLERPEHVFQASVAGLPSAFAPLKSLDTLPNNLPQQLTSFIGRETAIFQASDLLAQTRLLTITGAGGSGKTRLCLQIAADILEACPDGVWFVELASLADSALVAQTVANELKIKEAAGQSLIQTLKTDLKNQTLLLVLDNCEHLLSACAQLSAALLRACPNVKILATSREPLGIAGEQVYRVPPLTLPTEKQAKAATVDSVNKFEAARLFVERAQAVQNTFCVTNQSAPALAQLCCRLDGIPLAIELAAARVRSLAVEQINDKLDARFRLLTSGDRAALPRQQTLRALVDWSYDLLAETEKKLLARLSVFSGGWTLFAAETVCGYEPVEEWEVLDVLTSLVDKSLVVAEVGTDTPETRYRLLETLRQYAGEKLHEMDETESAQARHRDYFVALAEEAEKNQWSADQIAWMNRLETEHDNLRAALEAACCAGFTSSVETGLRFGGALWNFWSLRGYHIEGRDYLTRTIEQARQTPDVLTDSLILAKALYGAGVLAREQGDYEEAQTLQEENLALCRTHGDKTGMGNALNNLGLTALGQSDYSAATTLFEEGLAFRRETGNKKNIAGSLGNLGLVAQQTGNLTLARARYEESVTLQREAGNKQGIAQALISVGAVAYAAHDFETARPLFEESLRLYKELESRQGIAQALGCLASVSSDLKDYAAAQALYMEELAIRRALGDRPSYAVALTNLGSVLLKRGETETARENYAEALQIFQALGNKYLMLYALEGTAIALARSPQPAAGQKAVALWAATTALRQRIGVPAQEAEHSFWLDDARAALGDAAYMAAWTTGLGFSWEQANHCALSNESASFSFPASFSA